MKSLGGDQNNFFIKEENRREKQMVSHNNKFGWNGSVLNPNEEESKDV